MSELLPDRFSERSIGSYLDALASASPTPGGGSAAGLAGALGCSLGAMVCNLTLARHDDSDLSGLAGRFAALSERLVALAREDEQVFATYRAAMALPKASDEEKSARRSAIEQALVSAAETPLQMVECALAGLRDLQATAKLGTPHALGDLATGGYLLQAMVLGSLENIEANAALMKSPEHRNHIANAAQEARTNLVAAMSALAATIAGRTSAGS